jgi:predicted outer membrane repeat protein
MRLRNRWLIGAIAALAAALILIAGGGQGSLAAGDILFVDADATGAEDGSSWASAFTNLQPALEAAQTGDQIWVAEGTYRPTVAQGGTGDRYRSFQMVSGVAIYGGFDPSVGDTGWQNRDWVLHETILSGDLNGDDGPDFADNGENSYHVLYHVGPALDGSAILDGFTITGGNANGATAHSRGGGIYNYRASPALANCTFTGNAAGDGGGGMYNDECAPALTGCTFAGNRAGDGGGIYSTNASPSLTGCTFSHNSAGDEGGGMYNTNASPSLTGCTFAGNAAGYGAGMYNAYGSSPSLANCAFESNAAGYGGGGIYNYSSSSPVLTNCTFAGNSADYGGGMRNYSSSPALINCTFSGNSANRGGAIYNRSASQASPTLTNCILWGDTPEEMFNYDTYSTPVVAYSDVQGGCNAVLGNQCGAGNIDAHPFFVDQGDGELRLGACSPCIDRGDNSAAGLPATDFEGDGRIVDGDDDGSAVVDMGADEVAVAATCTHSYLPVVFRAY